jgi:hypothetical protein
MCIDYTNLNSACPKEEFVLPQIDQLIDSTAGSESLCFLDAYSGYNQIKMAEEDEEKTAFIMPFGCFCYTAMTFGLQKRSPSLTSPAYSSTSSTSHQSPSQNRSPSWSRSPAMATDSTDWTVPYIAYLDHQVLPQDETEACMIQRSHKSFVMIDNELYKHSVSGVFQRCVSLEEGRKIL